MNLIDKINNLHEEVDYLEQINSICPNISIIEYEYRNYYCSSFINKIATDIEILEPIYLCGVYRVSLYKDYILTSKHGRNKNIRVYGLPFHTALFEVFFNNLKFSTYEEELEKLCISEEAINKVNLYILKFIELHKLNIENIPDKIKLFLPFT